MGRKKRSCIYEFYDYDEDAATSKCLIEGCSAKIKGKHGANLLRHFQYRHKQEYERILESNKENFQSAESEANTKNTEILTKNLIALVTVHGWQFSLLENEAFQNIISLIPRVDKTAFTAQRIRELVEERAYKLQQPEAKAQGPWGDNSFEETSLSDSDSVDSNISETGPTEEYLEIRTDKKKRKERNKCRCCAEFTKDYVDATDKPYLIRNKIALTLNDVSIEMDFNEDTHKTVCLACDEKLQVMFDFMKQVKEAQGPRRDNVIKPQEPRIGDNVKKKVDYIVLKTEYESPADDEVNDIGCKYDIDPLTRAETFIRPIINKRKPVEVTIKTQKRPRVTGDVGENRVVDIQEDTAEMVDSETGTTSSDLDLRRLLINSIMNE